MQLKRPFWSGRRVLVTGHTGFKGPWLCLALAAQGAEVCGVALPPPEGDSLYQIAGIGGLMKSEYTDIRDFEKLLSLFKRFSPEIVFHLAAQPIVRASYEDPLTTYSTNVMGTVHVLEACRRTGVRSVVNVTTDKVYQNNEWAWGYRENDALDGYDPYSNSKSCSELVTGAYRRCFLSGSAAVSTARAGNVIGGGDFSRDRILPDCIRAVRAGKPVTLRNPASVRPYQHVLEPVFAYMEIACRQFENSGLQGSYNIGPGENGYQTTGGLAELFCRAWGDGASWISTAEDGPHEANLLKLDCSKIRSVFGWKPRWNVETAVEKTVEWTKTWLCGGDVRACMQSQIDEYTGESHV